MWKCFSLNVMPRRHSENSEKPGTSNAHRIYKDIEIYFEVSCNVNNTKQEH